MKQDIEIIEALSKTERVRRGNIAANVRTEGASVSYIEAGNVTDSEGNNVASFSQYQGSGPSVQFHAPDCDLVAILTEINSFINDVREG